MIGERWLEIRVRKKKERKERKINIDQRNIEERWTEMRVQKKNEINERKLAKTKERLKKGGQK